MGRNKEPYVLIEGLDVIIKRDLEKHQALLKRSKQEKLSYVQARGHEIRRKKEWRKHIGGGKFSDEALEEALEQISQNIAMYSDKVKLSDDAILHHTEIVDKLTDDLKDYNAMLVLAARGRDNGRADSD